MRNLQNLGRTALIVLMLCGHAAAQEAIHWQPNLDAAQRVASQSNRLILVHFWAPWCKPCMRLESEVFNQPEAAKALEVNYVCVKINVDESPGTTRLYGVSSLPTDVVITPTGRLVSSAASPPNVGAVHQSNGPGCRRPSPAQPAAICPIEGRHSATERLDGRRHATGRRCSGCPADRSAASRCHAACCHTSDRCRRAAGASDRRARAA